jgi:hypothetical protein
MSLQPSPWPVTTKLCSGKDSEDILVDGESVGEIRSETGKYRLDHQRDDGFAFPLPCEGPCRVSLGVRGTLPRPNSAANVPEMARPRHNSGYTEPSRQIEATPFPALRAH